MRARTDSGFNISLLLPSRTRILGQNPRTHADSKFRDPHLSGPLVENAGWCSDRHMSATAAEMRTFLNEALTMRDFRHQHILQLIGIVIDSDKMPLVILPFMTHGDLLSYIRDDNNVSLRHYLFIFYFNM